LVICDYRLGAETGTQFIADLPNHGYDLPTILLTGMADNEADRLALEAGASDFISKVELSPSLLDRTIRYAIANRRRQALLSSVVDSVSAAICVADSDANPVIWNTRFEELALRHDADGGRDTAITGLMRSALEDRLPRKIDGKVCDTAVTRLNDGRMVVTMHDVSAHALALEERERAVERADHMAMHCSLTGLPNRAALTNRLEHAVAKADVGRSTFTAVVIDIDRFKEINDVHGHQAGDHLLQEYSHRMNRCCTDKDYLGRMGGDEFVVVSESEDQGEALIERLIDAFSEPYHIDGRPVVMTASIGLADYPEHGSNVGDILSNADTAMFRSKANGRVPFLRYNSEIDQQTRYRRKLLVALKDAVEADAIDAHFQPQVCARSGTLRGFEVLARWHDATRGHVPPFEFITLAEENGFIDRIGHAVLRKACREAASWPDDLMLCVNISAAQIADPGFARIVHSILLETGLPPTRLELEVTETVLIDDFDKALFVLRSLKDLGVSLAIDDFGTGFSSLTTLAAFPFDRLKIDRSFVAGLDTDERLSTVVRACISLAKSLDLEVIAEGVETLAQAETLAALHCDQFQGYLYGRPLDASATRALIPGFDGHAIAAEAERERVAQIVPESACASH
ncbi:MAG: EAL domain-containing protein, partial [Pseudomonadota bacterium]